MIEQRVHRHAGRLQRLGRSLFDRLNLDLGDLLGRLASDDLRRAGVGFPLRADARGQTLAGASVVGEHDKEDAILGALHDVPSGRDIMFHQSLSPLQF